MYRIKNKMRQIFIMLLLCTLGCKHPKQVEDHLCPTFTYVLKNEYTYEECDHYPFLDWKSTLEKESIEASLIRLYLFQEYEIYQYEYSEEKKYMFVGQRKEDLSKIRQKIKFRTLFKLFFKKENRQYCFIRVMLQNGFNENKIHHFLMILDNGIWKSRSFMFEHDEYKYVNRLITNFKTEYIKELLDDSYPKSEILKNLKEQIKTMDETTQFKIYEYGKDGRTVNKEFTSFVHDQNSFSVDWIRSQIIKKTPDNSKG